MNDQKYLTNLLKWSFWPKVEMICITLIENDCSVAQFLRARDTKFFAFLLTKELLS